MNLSGDETLLSEIDSYLRRLFPICRSLTGEGNRETLRILNEIIPIERHEVASGTAVYDWVIPDEWQISDAWIATSDGKRIVDFNVSNLHVVGYSEPVRGVFRWPELQPHLHLHPDLPEAIPYRTSYYRRDWGFCLTHAQYEELEKHTGPFEVVIDSTLESGSLTYGECLLPGRSTQEILISTYICHPSLANDNLSGMLLTAFLAQALMAQDERYYSYRIVFVPETIGAIAYCAQNEAAMKQIDMGMVITTVGGKGVYGYKQSFDREHPINVLIEQVFAEAGVDCITYPFDIHGSDERQYSSQGFRINVASITRDKYYEYPYYHTSLDNLGFVTAEQIGETWRLYRRLIDKFEQNRVYLNSKPYCEVMLSKYGLYPLTGGAQLPQMNGKSELDMILWLLFLCDGKKSLFQIAKFLQVPLEILARVASEIEKKEILELV